MTAGQRTQGKVRSVPVSMLLSVGGELPLMIILCWVLAKLIDTELIPETTLPYGVWGILLISSFTGAQIACKRVGKYKLLCCLLSGCVFMGSLLSMTALFFEGQYDAVGGTVSAILLGCLLGILPVCLQKSRRKKRRKKQ